MSLAGMKFVGRFYLSAKTFFLSSGRDYKRPWGDPDPFFGLICGSEHKTRTDKNLFSSGGGLPGGALRSFFLCFLVVSALFLFFSSTRKSPQIWPPAAFCFCRRFFLPCRSSAHLARSLCTSFFFLVPFLPTYLVSVGYCC